ncbi:M23 family metallopeptidase [Gordonia paraffinivorans]|uniref:M23 family metallopeptidase n=1 Tax=Gordonia paraffinivorans TaxID=175628 RepID=UPI003FCDC1C8
MRRAAPTTPRTCCACHSCVSTPNPRPQRSPWAGTVIEGRRLRAVDASAARRRHDRRVWAHQRDTGERLAARVLAGAQIATVGNRGYSTGPHLHYKVWQQDGPKLDPAPWLRTRGVYVVGRPALSARGRYEDEWSRRCRESCRTTASTSASGGEHASAGTTCGVSPHGNNEVDVTARRSPTT